MAWCGFHSVINKGNTFFFSFFPLKLAEKDDVGETVI